MTDYSERIGGILRASEIMRSNIGDSFDRAYFDRTAAELNREIEALKKAPAPTEWAQQPPQPCPLGSAGVLTGSCYRRDGSSAVIDVPLHGPMCKGCERKVSTLEGGRP